MPLLRIQRITLLSRPLQAMRRIFLRIHAPLLQTPEILNWIRNTSNSRKSSTRNSSRTTRTSSKARSKTISG